MHCCKLIITVSHEKVLEYVLYFFIPVACIFLFFKWERNVFEIRPSVLTYGPLSDYTFLYCLLILIVKKTPLHKKPHLDHEKTTVTTCCLSLFEYLNCSPFSSTLYFPNTFPVNIAEGPQGSEYAVNMYRIFQHKLLSLNNKVYIAYVRV